MSALYCVYTLIDPRDNAIRYVGRTRRSIKARLTEHLNPTWSGNGERQNWIDDLKQAGIKPILKVIEEELTLEEADRRETYWIKYYLKLNAPLTNISKVWVYNESRSQSYNEKTGSFDTPIYHKRIQ